MKTKRIIKLTMMTLTAVISFLGLYSCAQPLNKTESVGDKASFTSVDRLDLSKINKYESSYLATSNVKPTDKKWIIVETGGVSLASAYKSSGYKGSLAEFAKSPKGIAVVAQLTKAQLAIQKALDDEKIEYQMKYSYTTLFGGLGIEVQYKDVERVKKIAGVKSVSISETYDAPKSVNSYEYAFDNLTGILNNDTAYQGEGMIVAVIDTGCDYNHEAFSNPLTDVAFTFADVDAMASATYAGSLGYDASTLYKSSKVPFGFDYADEDDDPNPGYMACNYYDHGLHGTHVAGMVAGDSDTIKGGVPKAQIAALKVFSDRTPGAYTTDIMAAVSDAAILGVDAINMSLGTANGFANEGIDWIDQAYDLCEDLGITLCVAAGNDGEAGDGTASTRNSTSNPDNGLIGSPATYSAAFAVASCNTQKVYYGFAEGVKVGFNSAANQTSNKVYPFMEELPFEEDATEVNLPYVVVPGLGDEADYADVDVEGKVAIVARGEITFEYKSAVAARHGAIAILIYNTSDENITPAIEGDIAIPTACIKSSAAAPMVKKGSGTIKFSYDLYYLQTSYFSSIGALPNLELKPDIIAPGTNIISAYPGNYQEGDDYGYMTGTSMASPNACGIAVAIRQYVKEQHPEMNNSEIQDEVYKLIMSTANVLADEVGKPETPRKQGAGLIDINAALTTDAYLEVPGFDRVKLSLGDDPSKTGVYTLQFNVTNFGTDANTYDLNTIVMTESVTADEVYGNRVLQSSYLFDDASREYYVTGAELAGNSLTVAPGTTAKVTVKVKLTKEDKKYLDSNFNNGMYVEGYVKLTATSDDQDLSIPWLAFYGDWDAAPIFDKTYYDNGYEIYPSVPLGVFTQGLMSYQFPLGAYELYMLPEGYEQPNAKPDKISLNYTNNSELYTVIVSLLRSVARLDYSIVDKYTGQVYWTEYATNVGKTYMSDSGDLIPTSYPLQISIPDYLVANNQQLEIVIKGTLDSVDGRSETIKFPLTLDYEAPTLKDARVYDANGKTYLEFKAYDNHYLSCFTLLTINADGDDYILLDNYMTPIYDDIKGNEVVVTYDITKYKNDINDGVLCLGMLDYALNEADYMLDCYKEYLDIKAQAEISAEKPVVGEDGLNTDSFKNHYSHVSLLDKFDYEDDEDDWIWDEEEPYDPTTPATIGDIENTGEEFVIVDGLLAYYNGRGGVVNVPAGVTVIGDDVFYRDTNITKLVLPEGVYYVGKRVCAGATSLKEVVLPSTVEVFDEQSFCLCTSLKVCDFSNTSVNYISWYAFSYCIALKEVILPKVEKTEDNPDGYMRFGYEAFCSCTSLKTLVINSDFETLANAFENCPKLTRLDFYGYVGRISEFSLACCDDLEEINFYGDCGEIGYTSIEDFGWDVRKEESGSFCTMPKLKRVNFYGNVESINSFAFSDCPMLTDVVLYKNLGYVAPGVGSISTSFKGFKVAEGNEYLVADDKNVVYNKEMTKAFTPAQWDYKGEYVLPETITELSESMFGLPGVELRGVVYAFEINSEGATCTATIGTGSALGVKKNLTKITLHEGITEVPDYCFFGLINADVVFQGDITYVGSRAFARCGIKEFNAQTVDQFGPYVFESAPNINKVLFRDDAELLEFDDGFWSTLTTAYMFRNCEKLEEVNLPSSISQIGASTFEGCSSLKTFDVKGAFLIEKEAFKGCSSLTSVANTNWLDEVGESAFAGCSSLVTVDLSNCSSIEDYAFANCSKLTGITLTDSLFHLGNFVFSYCESLESFEIPEGINGIDVAGSFIGCTSLESLVVNNNEYQTVDGVVYKTDGKTIVLYPAAMDGESFKAPSDVEEVGNYAFYGCKKLKTVDLSNVSYVGKASFAYSTVTSVATTNLEYVDNSAFEGCKDLASIDISKVKELGAKAFMSTALTSVTMPNNLTYIEGEAFAYCDKLTSVTISKDTCAFDFADTFFSSFNISTINVEEGNQYYSKDENALYNKNKTVLYKYIGQGATEFAIPEGVVKVSLNAFYGNKTLEKVTFPRTLKAIGDKAFYGCTSLKELVFNSTKAPTLEGLYSEDYFYPYANFVQEVEDLEEPLNIKVVHGSDSSYYTIIWEAYFGQED